MRNQIIHIAGELFLNYGFKSVTMDEIAQAMGISKKTIYVHFPTKTKLVETVTFTLFETICTKIDTICETSINPIMELYDVKMCVMQFLKDEKKSPQFQLKKYYPKIYSKLHKRQFDKMQKSVQTSLQKGVDLGLFRKNIPIDFISRLYFNGMTGIKDQDIFPSNTFSMPFLMENYLEYHLRAIVTAKGLQILQQIINKPTQVPLNEN